MDTDMTNGEAWDHSADGSDHCSPETPLQQEENPPRHERTPSDVSHKSDCSRRPPHKSSDCLEDQDAEGQRSFFNGSHDHHDRRRFSQPSVRLEDIDRKERRLPPVSSSGYRRPSQPAIWGKKSHQGKERRHSSVVIYSDCSRRSQEPALRPNSCESSGKASSANSDMESEDAMDGGVTTYATRQNGNSTVWKSFKKAGAEFNQDARKLFRYVGRKLNSRHGERHTKVKKIHILPGEDGDRVWATRIAGSGTSRSSSSSDPSN